MTALQFTGIVLFCVGYVPAVALVAIVANEIELKLQEWLP